MKNKKGFISMSLVYTFLILFLFLMLAIIAAYTNKNKFILAISNKTKEDLKVKATIDNTLSSRILKDNDIYSDKESSSFVASNGIDFSLISSETNGRGLYYTDENTIENKRVYYFRGNVENNNIIFAGFCWRIVRTNEDGSIKLRYNGIPNDNTCPAKGVISSLPEEKPFNVLNVTDFSTSSIKSTLENWYISNIENQGENITSKIIDVPYCSDKSNLIASGNVSYYGALNRIGTCNGNICTAIPNAQPIFRCPNSEDENSVENGKLNYPIALLTLDEIVYAGGTINAANSDYYMYNGSHYWTMSPFSVNIYNNNTVADVSGNGRIYEYGVTQDDGVYPVISIDSSVNIIKGNGKNSNPYIVGE